MSDTAENNPNQPPNDSRFRKLGERELIVAEQAILNLALQAELRISRGGVDITDSLTRQAPRINAAYDAAYRNDALGLRFYAKPGPPAKKAPAAPAKKFRDPSKRLSQKLGTFNPAKTSVPKPAMKKPADYIPPNKQELA